MRNKKLFKPDIPLMTRREVYAAYVEDSLKPLGFEESLDESFYDIKRELFMTLFDETLTSGASYDAVIAFQSIIDDMTETFHEISPSLDALQRSKTDGEK